MNVPAMTDNATPAWAARVDTVPSTSAPPELVPAVVLPAAEGVAAAFTPEAVTVVKPDCEAAKGVLEGVFVFDCTAAEGAAAALERGTRGTTEVPFVAVPFEVVLLPVGGGTALDGSTRAPVPQGIFWPSGWVGLGAGTVLPDASEMVKRPVHNLSVEAGEVNW